MAFQTFQSEMRTLLDEMKQRGQPDPDDHDIAAQLYRAMSENPDISEDRVLSEIGMLFVEGFETTGGQATACFIRCCRFLAVHTSLSCLVDRRNSVGALAYL